MRLDGSRANERDRAESPASATTNSPAAPPPPRAPTLIDSDSADFDLNGAQAIYRGHVRVDDPQMKLTCEQLTADLPQAGGRVNHIVAETNVVIDFTDDKGQTNHATGDKAVYDLQRAKRRDERNGHAHRQSRRVENAQGTQTGDVDYLGSREQHGYHFDNPHMIFRQNLNGATADTNSPANAKNTIFRRERFRTLTESISNIRPSAI